MRIFSVWENFLICYFLVLLGWAQRSLFFWGSWGFSLELFFLNLIENWVACNLRGTVDLRLRRFDESNSRKNKISVWISKGNNWWIQLELIEGMWFGFVAKFGMKNGFKLTKSYKFCDKYEGGSESAVFLWHHSWIKPK